MSSPTVIVFGPTGAVGSSAARTAASLGANVILAMRDTSKSIPGLDPASEKSGQFQRVTADLTKPDTVRDTVISSGAKHAFIYLAHGMPDAMRSTIQALKDAKIELVVFLSSFTVPADPASVPADQLIPYFHAQVELRLAEIFGKEGYVALRPGAFASNTRQYKSGLHKGEVKMYKPEGKVDGIVPENIGWVAGTVLTKGVPADGNRTPYLYGPELITQRETAQILAKVLGKEIKIVESDAQEEYRMAVEERGVPPPLAKYMTDRMGLLKDGGGFGGFWV